jgi:hypothetical protein
MLPATRKEGMFEALSGFCYVLQQTERKSRNRCAKNHNPMEKV